MKGFRIIKESIKNTTFLKERASILAENIGNILDQIKAMDEKVKKMEGTAKFLEQLHTILEEAEYQILRCERKGRFARAWSGIVKKEKYTEKYDNLEKRLNQMVLTAQLLNIVSYNIL